MGFKPNYKKNKRYYEYDPTTPHSAMKIITINIPVMFLDKIRELNSKEFGLYPSRSELIRVAIRDFLIKELKLLDRVRKPESKENKECIKKKGDKETVNHNGKEFKIGRKIGVPRQV